MNAGAYMSEIFRGAIEAVNKGQMEAARSLGTVIRTVDGQDNTAAGSADMSAVTGKSVHYHIKGFHDPLRYRPFRDNVLRQDLCGKNF